ncbi:putative deoxyribonuclease YcfH [Vibrio aerogenes CECT 7868]|uniref:Putative deoxyribonuclease YcfH n=1 Tax=Vibrio aerogenes CECT 7868 TaxID=1216006 RepID=A0A1M5ZFE3_9VIBR|nr:TatD family hydrolase [Vibrio aerogenes]SHI22889.1 putative deoxyribonuclease YcfH [Vibrio aerogenes CECT 7868]
MIDTHAHIYASEFDPDRDDVIQRARQAGIEKILMPNIDPDSIAPMLATESAYPDFCYAMMGLHPCYVDQDYQQKLALIEHWFEQRDFIAVGEIGIDLYWDKTYKKQQEIAFITQLQLAKQKQRPVVIHTRDSIQETLALVQQEQDGSLRGVFHCFGGTRDEAQQIIDSGFHLGLGGVTTFKNGGMDQVVPHLDLSHIILETDCPYLAPVPHRGKRNEPTYTQLVAERIATLKSCSPEDVDRLTTQNAKTLFRLS